MALAQPAGTSSSPARTASVKTPACLSPCHSPVKPSSAYGTLHNLGRVLSPVHSKSIHRSPARLSIISSCSPQISKAARHSAQTNNVARSLHVISAAQAPAAIVYFSKRAGAVAHCSNSTSDSQPYDNTPRPISPVPRSNSPFTTAEPNSFGSAALVDNSSNTISSANDTEQQQQQQQQSQSGHTIPSAAAAAAVLPSVDLSSPDAAAQAAAAAEAQAAVTASLSVSGLGGQHPAGGAVVSQEAKAQDLLTFLRLQVRTVHNSDAAMHTLLLLVKSAATNQLPLSTLMAPSNLKLWQNLLTAEAPVAVLAAEVLCRVCNQDLEPWTQQLSELIPMLLSVVKNVGTGDSESEASKAGDTKDTSSNPTDSKSIPLVFFAISALVRMSAVEALALEIVKQGGVQRFVAALTITNAAVRQVTTFALFRLMREIDGDLSDDELMHWTTTTSSSSSSSGGNAAAAHNSSPSAFSRDLLLVQYARHGAFPKLCSVLADSSGGSAHELTVSMLLSMSIIPEVAKLVADRNEVQHIVKVLSGTSSSATRLESMLVAARLCARHTACQQDAVREGAVPVLVAVMNDSSSSDEERCHAARLLAILGQHASTHQIIMECGALSSAIQIIQDRGHQRTIYNNIVSAAKITHFTETSDKKPVEIWEAAQAIYDAAIAVGLSGAAASSAAAAGVAAAVAESGDRAEQQKVAVQQHMDRLADAQQQQRVSAESHSSSSSSSSSSTPIGPALVLEQAAGVVCMLSHNLDNHFKMVGEGLVPLMVSLLGKDTLPKTLSYSLASLLMLAVSEPRHAAVVARTGAVGCLVELIGADSSAVSISNREMSAALLAVLCRSRDVADDVVNVGGIQALVRLLSDVSASGRCYACEALSQLAVCSAGRCQQVMRAQVMTPLKHMISSSSVSSSSSSSGGDGSSSSSSQSLMWSSRLLQVLARDAACLRELCRVPGLVAMVPDILRQQTVLPAAAAAADFGSANSSSNSSTKSVLSAAAAAADIPDIPVMDVLNITTSTSNSRDGVDDRELNAAAAAVAAGMTKDGDLEKAQSNLCWVIAALATDMITRPVIVALGQDLIPPLIIILRDSQAGHGSGYSLSEVLAGITHSRQAAAVAALRALSRADDQLAAGINAELTVQRWLGYRVELPAVNDDDDYWPFAPGWYLKG